MKRKIRRRLNNNNIKIPVILPILVIISVLCLSIGFSAFQENMLVTDTVADIRLKKDIRVTNASQLELSTDSYLNSLDYNKTNISGLAGLPYSDSSITVNVEITNIEAQEMGIYDLVLNNPNLDYRINNYTKKDKLCDDINTSKCNLGSTSNISVTIFYKENMYNSENIEQNFILEFDFRGFYTITYIDIPGTYQNSIMDGETLQVDFGENAIDKIMITMGGVRLTNQEYTYINGVITVPNIDGNIEISPFQTDPSCFVSTTRAQINNYICEDTDVVIPKNLMLAVNGTGTEYKVTTIGNNAFKEKGLTSVVISDDITRIEGNAFQNNLLTEVIIPDSVTYMNNYVFDNNKLKSVKLPNNISALYNYSFSNNELEEVTIPASVTILYANVFANNKLRSVDFSNTTKLTTLHSGDFQNNLLTSINIPESVTTIGPYSFQNNNLVSVKIPSLVTTIGTGAFQNNEIINLDLDDNVSLTNIDNSAFENNKIEYLSIPNSVTRIGDSTFRNNNISSIDFNNTTKLTTIVRYAFQDNQLISVDVPDSVTNLGHSLFKNNRIERATLPSKITDIPYYLFQNNYLTSITIPNGITTIYHGAFENNLLETIQIPASVTTIHNGAFRNNNLTSIEIPDSVTSIAEGAFNNNKLEYVKIGNGITSFNSNGCFSGSTSTRTKYDGTTITYGPNAITKVVINNSASNVSINNNIFRWASGYSNANICWLGDDPTCGD